MPDFTAQTLAAARSALGALRGGERWLVPQRVIASDLGLVRKTLSRYETGRPVPPWFRFALTGYLYVAELEGLGPSPRAVAGLVPGELPALEAWRRDLGGRRLWRP
jgi:hypothetical protein